MAIEKVHAMRQGKLRQEFRISRLDIGSFITRHTWKKLGAFVWVVHFPRTFLVLAMRLDSICYVDGFTWMWASLHGHGQNPKAYVPSVMRSGFLLCV